MITYNHGPYIRKAIESVLSQKTNFPVELLIGEDHSTDNTRVIIHEYELTYPDKIRVLTSDGNVGAKKNLQRVESASLGKYIAYCEGDDYWHDSGKLQKQIDFLEANPAYSFVHTDYKAVALSTGDVISNAGRQPKDLDDRDAYNDLLSGRRNVLTLTVCARASTLRPILAECQEIYNPRFLMGDTQRWLELARRGRVKFLPSVTATHVLLNESASQSQDPKRTLRFILSCKDLLTHYVEKYPCPSEVKTAAMVRANIEVLKCAYAAEDFLLAKQMYRELSILHAPHRLPAMLYCFGSASFRRRQVTKPALAALEYWKRVRKRAARLLETG